MTVLVSLRDAAVARGGRVLIEGVTLDVAAGDVVWIQGPNGSGKSTLLRAMAGLAPLAAGEITPAQPPQQSLAYLGHRSGFDPESSVASTSRFWLSETDRRRLPDVLDTTLARGRRMAELSAGQTRKMEILRLVGSARPLWLLDEPYASLDAQSGDRLTATITDHLSRGGACVIASHAGLPAFGRDVRLLSIGAPA